jgi:hypothetical protein
MKAMCKQRRSSEVLLAFLQKFHRKMASCCQCCGSAVSALLKACESFKEKQLFCFTISAAAKKFYAESRSPRFLFVVARLSRCATAGMARIYADGHEDG